MERKSMMKTTDIKIGSVYALKVGRNTTPVRIMKAAEKGGWEAIGLATNKPLTIKTASRLVAPKTPTAAPGAKSAAKSSKSTSQAKQANTAHRAPTSAKAKHISALDSAQRLLAETKEPMTCRQLIEAMAAKGYWQSVGGKTPQNTLHAAIAKEIRTKGKASRFRKVGRGQFALAK